MDWILYVLIGVMIVVFWAQKTFMKETPKENATLPYKKRDDFLSASELSFYRTLNTYLEGKAMICPKVAVKEIVFIGKGIGKEYMKFFNYIAKKHVDFVLCDWETMQIKCAVELDDKSHQREARKQRDAFLDRVFETAQIPLFHSKAKNGYTKEEFKDIISCFMPKEPVQEEQPAVTPASIEAKPEEKPDLNQEVLSIPVCPKCSIPMVRRKATQGANAGNEFYGCSNYPRCREIKPV